MLNQTPIAKSNLYEVVAQRLEEAIIAEPTMVGTRLPSEQELADTYQVSRNIVRESLKILKERGLVVVKNGEGAFIATRQAHVLGKTIHRMVLLGNSTYEDIYQVRMPIELQACRLAAEKIDDEGIRALQEIVDKMEQHALSRQTWMESDLLFHTTIADLTRNQLLGALVKSLSRSYNSMYTETWPIESARMDGLMGHKEILTALKLRDADRAEAAMQAHLSRSLNNLMALEKE